MKIYKFGRCGSDIYDWETDVDVDVTNGHWINVDELVTYLRTKKNKFSDSNNPMNVTVNSVKQEIYQEIIDEISESTN